MGIKKILINLIPIRKYRKKLRNELCDNKFELDIKANTKCLMICPHADDEIIGAGGVMLHSPSSFDCICIGSSGVAYKDISAEKRSKIRMQEFFQVMQELGIKKFWIFETFGKGCLNKQIQAHLQDYLKVLNTAIYDYIFIPVPHDRHPEHNYITNTLVKNILLKNGYKSSLKIVFYEVWSLIPNPNCFVDITDVIDKKSRLLSLYKSQHVWINYAEKTKALNSYRGMQNNNSDYSEAFYITSVNAYLKKGYQVKL